MKKIHIFQLIPEDRIGGVELSAKSFLFYENKIFKFSVEYIFNSNDLIFNKSPFCQFIKIFKVAKKISKSNVDVIVLSLWRSCLCGLFVKLFNPKIQLITFLHSSRDVHKLDYFITRLAAFASFRIFADSSSSIVERLPFFPSNKIDIISFLINNYTDCPPRKVAPHFVFWGRLSKEKGLDIAINFFYKIHEKFTDATFLIIGPDCGSLKSLKLQVKCLNLESSIFFCGPLSTTYEIVKYSSNASFYLQTSLFEGMGMSVVEAMQLGLVPIVSPVGEIAKYCLDGHNSIFINKKDTLNTLFFLLENDSAYQYIRLNSISTWKSHRLYSESMILACEKISELLKTR